MVLFLLQITELLEYQFTLWYQKLLIKIDNKFVINISPRLINLPQAINNTSAFCTKYEALSLSFSMVLDSWCPRAIMNFNNIGPEKSLIFSPYLCE